MSPDEFTRCQRVFICAQFHFLSATIFLHTTARGGKTLITTSPPMKRLLHIHFQQRADKTHANTRNTSRHLGKAILLRASCSTHLNSLQCAGAWLQQHMTSARRWWWGGGVGTGGVFNKCGTFFFLYLCESGTRVRARVCTRPTCTHDGALSRFQPFAGPALLHYHTEQTGSACAG